jgi:hypothetical protein
MITCSKCGGEIDPATAVDVPAFGFERRPWEQTIWDIQRPKVYRHVICPDAFRAPNTAAGVMSD